MKRFWDWYERHYVLNLSVAAILFSLQLVHLFWLTTHVVWQKLFGFSIFSPSGPVEWIIILVDYTEIPALIAASLIYLRQIRAKASFKPILYLLFLNIQVIHMFWITDEFVVSSFSGQATNIPGWLAWIAILIDYLELPVIFETMKMFLKSLKKGAVKEAFTQIREAD